MAAASAAQPPVARERWDRSARLPWYDERRVAASHALVVGAGALGNEVAKDLALSGVGRLTLVDPDRVELTNLNRCALFTPEDARQRRPKARALADALARLVPEATIEARTGRVEREPEEVYEVDVVVTCVDNVAARLHVNARARRRGRVVVDGGTLGMSGKVQVVWEDGDPCLECATNVTHRRVLEERYACSGREATVHVPPMAQEITTTAIVAAVQAREALKAILGLAEARQRGVLAYDGMRCRFDHLQLTRAPACAHHGRRST